MTKVRRSLAVGEGGRRVSAPIVMLFECCPSRLFSGPGRLGSVRSSGPLEYNARAIRTYHNCGFSIEGRQRQAACINGQRHDDLIMGLLATD